MAKQLHDAATQTSPFAGAATPKRERHAHWVRPTLVAQIRFANWTRDGLLRQPAFLGLREDKPAKRVHREVAHQLSKVAPKAKSGRAASKASLTHDNATHGKASAAALRQSPAAEATMAGIRLTHPDKVLYPDDGLTKRDLADYYLAVGEWMLPHVANRPLSIVRCPDGLGGQKFLSKASQQGHARRAEARRDQGKETPGTNTS